MSYRGPTIVKEPALGILLYLFAGLLATILWKGFAELAKLDLSRPSPGVEQRLEGALRAGALEFDEYRERIVIETELMEYGCVQVSDADGALCRFVADFVGCSVDVAALEPAAGQQQRKRVAVVIATAAVL